MENIKRLIEIREKGIEAVNIDDINVLFQILCDFINVNPEVQKLIEGNALRIILKIEDAETYNLIIEDQNAIFTKGSLKTPDFIIRLNLKTIFNLFLGQLDPLEAYFSESFKIEGDLLKVIIFVDILELAFKLLEVTDNQDTKRVIDANSMKDLINVYLNGPSKVKPSQVPLFLEVLTVFVNNNPEAQNTISEEDLSIQLKLIDLDNYVISITDNKMSWYKGDATNPNFVLEMNLESSADLLINGNPVSAFMNGKIKIEGDIAKALILQDLIDIFLDFINL
ncbi:MAG: SCP2 sterol-binding domain-containing protein [Candidatus Thorarchaeota archaeon]